MRLFCRLCGARTDGQERLGVYCPGNRCGSDLRGGDTAAVQAWCEPERQRGAAGRTVTVRLVVRNAGPRADTYRVEPVEQVDGRLDFDASLLNAPFAPDEARSVEARYTLPRDRVGLGIDVASRFGVPGADAAGQVNDGRSDRFGVALRVVSTTANQGAACAAFAVDVPGRYRPERDDRTNGSGTPRGRSLPMVVGGAVVALIIAVAAVVAVAQGKDDDPSTSAGDGASPVQPIGIPGPGTTDGGDTDGGDTDGGNTDGQSGTNSGSGTSAGKGGGTNSGSGTNQGSGTNTGSSSGKSGGTNPGGGKGSPVPEVVDVAVPQTVGRSEIYAKDSLDKAGLTYKVEVVEGSGGPEGDVISTSPAAGSLVSPGSTVLVRVKDGMVRIPTVLGLDMATAQTKLEALDLKVQLDAKVSDSKYYGLAVATSPAVNSLVPRFSTVILYKGKPDIR